MSGLIDVGRLVAPYGIKGWLKLHSQTDPVGNIFDYQPWLLKTAHGVRPFELLEWRPHGKFYVVQIKGICDRNAAELLCPVTVAVDKTILPELREGDYYWHQLQGCRLVLANSTQDLGVVRRIMATGANDVLVVQGDDASIDQRERLVPYVLGQFVKEVNLDLGIITVDWDPDF